MHDQGKHHELAVAAVAATNLPAALRREVRKALITEPIRTDLAARSAEEWLFQFVDETLHHRVTELVAQSRLVVADHLRASVHVIALGDPLYPRNLAPIQAAPLVLYCRGAIDRLEPSARTAAVIGTRKPSALGIELAKRTAHALATRGWSVVSGLALGVDAAAHEACLQAGGRTLAVLPGPLDNILPARNRALADEIVRVGGVLVSELPFGKTVHRSHYVMRDRIIAGLSDCVIPVEAELDSGTLHTVRYALKYRRHLLIPEEAVSGALGSGLEWIARETPAVPYAVDDLHAKLLEFGVPRVQERLFE